MSDAELSERDTAVLNAATATENPETDPAADSKTNPAEGRLETLTSHTSPLKSEVAELQSMLAETRRALAEERQRRTDLEARLEALEAGSEPRQAADGTLLDKYAAMPSAERAELMGASERRAVRLYECWWDIAEQGAGGNYAVTTRRRAPTKNSPSKLKIDLENLLDEDLAWEQVYRAMKAMARLSAPAREEVETTSDEHGRTRIAGGAFEYQERATPDGKDRYRVVELVDGKALTAL